MLSQQPIVPWQQASALSQQLTATVPWQQLIVLWQQLIVPGGQAAPVDGSPVVLVLKSIQATGRFLVHCSKYHRSARRLSDFRNFGGEAFENFTFCYAPLEKYVDLGKQKHPVMTPYPQGARKCSKLRF